MLVAQERAIAPGARVEVRDEEWLVRTTKNTAFGGLAVHVVGLSELVQGKEAIFLTDLDEVRELLPEETELVHDDSPQYRRSRLYLESLLRRTPATDDGLYIGHKAAINRTDYQLQPAAKALRQLRPRILMADGVGLGKTMEVGILLSELIQRGKADRILVVALKSVLTQFQKEMWGRFTIPLVRLDSVGIQRVQSRIPSNMNPFYYFDRVIISIDTLKRDEKYRRYLEECHWDVVVVDECQHVAVRTRGGSSQKTQRARLAGLLGRTSDALILTSATPHDGRPESFASLINLLEPTAVADESDYTSDEIAEYFIRRFKKDIAHEVSEQFREREITLNKQPASPKEDAVFEALSKVEFKTIARQRSGKGVLFRTLLLKAFLSSPAACKSTIEHRLAHKDLQEPSDDRAQHDVQALNELKDLVEAVKSKDFTKLHVLLQMLRDLGFADPNCTDRIVIFSERIDTLKFLDEQLSKELGLKSDQIEVFHGTLDDQKQQHLVESFGTERSPIRILLASDVASEGINLHYYCHRMIHFDLPWSLITLEQRNGRIDRFGQKRTPYITYLLTIPNDPKLKGDLRVLERLIEKEDAAHKNLGDVAWLLNLHEAEKEEDEIGRGIEEGKEPEQIIPDEAQHTDFMELIFGEDAPSEPAPEVRNSVHLFRDDLVYAREAFNEVLGDEHEIVTWHDHLEGFTLHPPDDLLRRFEYLPQELRNDKNEIKLSADRELIMDAMEKARQEENRWPEWQLFWPQHPLAQWIGDRVLGRFARHQAPVLQIGRGIENDERLFVFQGVVSNRRSQPTLVDWFAVRMRDDEVVGISAFSDVVESVALDQDVPNPGRGLAQSTMEQVNSQLQTAVKHAREHMMRLRRERAEVLGAPLREGLRRLSRWQAQSLAQLDERRASIEASGRKVRKDEERRLANRRREIEKIYQQRKDWIEKTMRTVDQPYLRLAAVLVPLGMR